MTFVHPKNHFLHILILSGMLHVVFELKEVGFIEKTDRKGKIIVIHVDAHISKLFSPQLLTVANQAALDLMETFLLI